MNNSPHANAPSGDDRLRSLLTQLGASDDLSQQIKKAAASNPTVAAALGRLSSSDLEKVSAILSDKSATEKILATPQAQSLLRKLREE